MKQQLLGVILGFALLLTAMIALPLQGSLAAPAAAPTPIAAPGQPGTPSNVTFWGTSVISTDTRANAKELSAYNRVDLEYTVVMSGTDVNTTTLYFQTSCSGQRWDAGLAFASAIATDTTAVVSVPNFCRYQAVYADVSNTQPVTITVLGVAKN